jgi:WD domain, G-beta repeat
VKLWDARSGKEILTLPGHTGHATRVAFSPDGQRIASAGRDGTVKLWDPRSGKHLLTLRGHPSGVICLAFSPDERHMIAFAGGDGLQVANASTNIQVVQFSGTWDRPRETPARLHEEDYQRGLAWHSREAVVAEQDKNGFAAAFHLSPLLCAENLEQTLQVRRATVLAQATAATLAGCLGTESCCPGQLPGLLVAVNTPFHEAAFPDDIACTGVLYKDSGIAPARLLIGISRALAGDPANWLNHAFHGGALFRNGEHAKALAALNEAVRLRGKPSPLTHNLLSLTYIALGQKDKAKDAFAKARPTKDAPWEDAYLQRLFRPEVDAALANAEGKQPSKERRPDQKRDQ